MATLDDKLLGEKLHNYCSSSESEQENSDNEENIDEEGNKLVNNEPPPVPPPVNKWEGSATNTGPKGVINDWQKFKQLEHEKRLQQEAEKLALIKKLSLTCDAEDQELNELLDDNFLVEYQKKRMEEMLKKANELPTFESVILLNSQDDFLQCIENENKNVCIIVHLYENSIKSCKCMNDCLEKLCLEYRNVKFCKISSTIAGMSINFKVAGLPALLVYKGGQMIGNFVKITDELSEVFYPEDVEQFLIEHGVLFDKNCVPKLIHQSQNDEDSD